MSNNAPPYITTKNSVTTEKGIERMHEILHAARQLFAAEGYAGLSMRRLALTLNMSLSNVQHYYKSKDILVDAMLMYTMNIFQAKIDNIAQTMQQASRIDQFNSTIEMFLDELSDPVTHGVFFEIWALAERNVFASELMDKMIARERKTIFKLIQGLVPDISDEQAKLRAVLIVAQVEGLMLFRLHKNVPQKEVAEIHTALRKSVLNLATVP
ncbi:Bacterial regulatory protein, tetR family [Solimicrobium silvestre]|uniref:Bacterial regulatory protein, tetR family n=2 Tax=Solimicrobium silvestre TaxID=2099400 RepID=A0A2S9GSI5_9BURK|nr:Bacterial regulatory protein, tetR family [Solimicrobium silvestre]